MKDFKTCMRALRKMSVPVRWRMLVIILIGMVRIGASLAFVWASKHLVDIATGVCDESIWNGIYLFIGILAV